MRKSLAKWFIYRLLLEKVLRTNQCSENTLELISVSQTPHGSFISTSHLYGVCMFGLSKSRYFTMTVTLRCLFLFPSL